ncbi:MAG: aspartate aminotransferase family protein, partial [Acidobacteria bacterium]|nr:aspartate aminotransferase family protein [Acidobacteriota bacterium]
MDLAIRFARQHHLSAGRPERWRVFGRDLSYHGATMATLAVGGHKGRRAGFEHWLVDEQTDQPRPPAHYCMRCPMGKTFPSCDIACADEVERVFEEIGPEEIAAFVVEPIVGSNAGALVPPGDYLERVARICRRHGVLLIADEVMTGYGRTGRKFGVDHWDIVPDILVGGKGLTGGYAPLVAICARDEVTEPIRDAGDSVMFFTYGAHSPACAAASEVLRILEDEELVERAATVGAELGERLRETFADHPHVACSTASRSSRTAKRSNRSPPTLRWSTRSSRPDCRWTSSSIPEATTRPATSSAWARPSSSARRRSRRSSPCCRRRSTARSPARGLRRHCWGRRSG